MAATRGVVTSTNKDGRTSTEASRLGHRVEAKLATWDTFLETGMNADGSGWARLRDDKGHVFDIGFSAVDDKEQRKVEIFQHARRLTEDSRMDK